MTLDATALHPLLFALVGFFGASEVVLAIRRSARRERARSEDRGSVHLLRIVIALSLSAALAFSFAPIGAIRMATGRVQLLALALLVLGLVVRWSAILTLGRYFTVEVAIQADHRLVEHGLYRHVRHPSYSGLLLAFLGLGFFLGNWFSLILVFVPNLLALAHRIGVEERALIAEMGGVYEEYRRRTKRLVPGIV
ncbi:MAG: isoprenylcysteine carboxylmethyltransferase family protein [Candidatus Eisenbacteria bacterium]